jgi:hypothetical protein
MALSPMNGSAMLMTALSKAAAITSDGKPTGAQADTSTFPVDFATGYNNYAKAGIIPGAAPGSEQPSIISNFLEGAKSAGGADVAEFALALAEYWATVLTSPGAPAHGGMSVISVTNNAILHVDDFEAAIKASMTSSESKPYYFAFVSNVENIAVKKIIWTVTEMMPGSPPSPSGFPELIT